jgi:hypothetical protein
MTAAGSFPDLVVLIAPWLSALFAIGAAIAAERSFRQATEAQPPERWRGEDAIPSGIDFKEEIDERSHRNAIGIDAAATQSIATYLAAAAAIEAAGASQHGAVAILATAFGLVFAGALSGRRMLNARRNVEYERASFIRMKWDIDRKWVRADEAAEDQKFAEDHPAEARVLRRKRR